VLPNIINIDQTSYLKGHYIGENIRLTQDVIHFTNLTNQKGIAIFLDSKKRLTQLSGLTSTPLLNFLILAQTI